jgi:hypothetical protein
MKKKDKVIAFVLFALVTVGVYAQNASLREGYYQTQGSADHIFIAPNRADSGKGTTPETAFTPKSGSYGIMAWVGMPEPGNILYNGTGNIVGSEFRFNIERRIESNLGIPGAAIPRGVLIIWKVTDNQTFYDDAGNRWIWRRGK